MEKYMKRILFLVLGVLLMANGKAFAEPEKWSSNGHYYEWFSEKLSWNDAKNNAQNLGGYLATSTSSAENSFLLNNFNFSGHDQSYLGGYQSGGPEPAGGWKWVTNESWSYTNWDTPYQPDNWNSPNGRENYLTLYHNAGEWNDYAQPAPYIVEWNKNPDTLQKIYIDWENPIGADFQTKTIPVLNWNYLVTDKSKTYTQLTSNDINNLGGEQYKQNIVNNVKSIFSNSGITGIQILDSDTTTTKPADALVVHFGMYDSTKLNGVVGTAFDVSNHLFNPIDQFNERADGEIAIFLDYGEGPYYAANNIAHEVGHGLGLRHINPYTGNYIEVMDYDSTNNPDVNSNNNAFNSLEKFTNEVSYIYEPPTDARVNSIGGALDRIINPTHNPTYHLLKYTSGESDTQLADEHVAAGSWDTQPIAADLITGTFKLTDSSISELYGFSAMLFSGAGGFESNWYTMAYYDELSIADVENLSFSSSRDFPLYLFASSLPDSDQMDILFGFGDENSPDFNLYDYSGNELNGKIFRYLASENRFETIGSFQGNFTGNSTVPEPASILLFGLATPWIFFKRKQKR